jgi:hypothetical protein
MDSTFLGTLLTLQNTLTKRGEGSLVLLAPSPGCSKLLHQMGLDTFIPTEQNCPDDIDSLPWADLPAEPHDVGSFQRNVVQAHEELANLPGPAGEQFRAVARCLAQTPPDKPPQPPPGKRSE